MTTYLPRTAWTDTPRGFPRFEHRKIKPDDVTAMHLHYPGDGGKRRAGLSQAAVAGLLRGYRRYHVETRRWADIGYCWAIDQAGRVWNAAGDDYAAAHSATPLRPDENARSVGVLLVLGDDEAPSEAMAEAIRDLRASLRRRYRYMRDLDGHQQVPGASTRCPGPHVMRDLSSGRYLALDKVPTPVVPASDGTYRGHAVDGQLGPYTVRSLQAYLRDQGWTGHAVDGDLGPYTVKSLQRFLRSRGEGGHAVDGDLGPYTVTSLQRFLRAEGHPGHAVDGDLGAYTVTSLQQYLYEQ